MLFNGLRVIESVYLTEAGEPYEQRRSWRERLFTRPWRPFQRTRTFVPQVPMKGGYQLDNGTIVMHPAMVKVMREQLESAGSAPASRSDRQESR